MGTVGALLSVLMKTRYAGAAASPTHLMRALATTSTSSSECSMTVADACVADAECVACGDAFAASVDSCVGDSTTLTCDVLEDVACCASSGCEENVLFADYIGCVLIGFECGVIDVAACVAISDGTSTTGLVPTTTSSTTTAFDDISTTTSDISKPTDSSSINAATDDTTSSTTSICQTELGACATDDACMSCLLELDEGTEAVQAACYPAVFDEETAACSERTGPACCAFEEGPECLAELGDKLVALLDCTWESQGCDFSVTECVDAASATTSNGGDDDEADAVDMDGDDEDAHAGYANAADADTDSATLPAAVAGAAAVNVAAAVCSTFFINA
eukprot:g1601.t2